MNEFDYNLQFDKLCEFVQIGKMTCPERQIFGGHLHKMFAIETECGKFAVKAINPQIMLRPEARNNTIMSEKIARIAARHISALPARLHMQNAIQEIEGQLYMVFDWVEGKTIFSEKIESEHCVRLGELLARLHSIDFSELDISRGLSEQEPLINWREYLQKGVQGNLPWVPLMEKNLDNLYEWNNKVIRASEQLASDMIISHRDMDPKNVLWVNYNPIIIDWEAAGFINKNHDILETALYWANTQSGAPNKNKFCAFMNGYKAVKRIDIKSWDAVLDKGFSALVWLEYSLKRSLMIECTDKAEQSMGTEHVVGTISSLLQYSEFYSELRNWLEEM